MIFVILTKVNTNVQVIPKCLKRQTFQLTQCHTQLKQSSAFLPGENIVIDNRNDAEKVKDILRVWSQLLTSDEREIWNEIADRDLTRDISLESGIRTPKTFIENEIKAFRNIKANHKSELIQALNKTPEFHNSNSESEVSNYKQYTFGM